MAEIAAFRIYVIYMKTFDCQSIVAPAMVTTGAFGSAPCRPELARKTLVVCAFSSFGLWSQSLTRNCSLTFEAALFELTRRFQVEMCWL
jgi:hypothetical protein